MIEVRRCTHCRVEYPEWTHSASVRCPLCRKEQALVEQYKVLEERTAQAFRFAKELGEATATIHRLKLRLSSLVHRFPMEHISADIQRILDEEIR